MEISRKEKITIIAHDDKTGNERELTFEFSDNVIECYWEMLYDGESKKDRQLFALDYEENFKPTIKRMLEIWKLNKLKQ